MVEFRQDHEEDLEALRALRRACGGARLVVHAWEDGRLVGFARALSDGVSTAYVASVMVAPELRRRGVGRALMQALTDASPGLKLVLHARTEAREFYEALGFVPATGMYVRGR